MENGQETEGHVGLSSVDPKKMARAIAAFPQSNLNRTMSSASVPPIQMKLDRSDSTLSTSVIERLRELRHLFASRTEEVRRRGTAAKADVHSSAEEEQEAEDEATGEVTTDPSRTENDLVLNENLGDQMKKVETKHWWSAHPGRKLVIRQPFCTACLAPHRKHFIVFQDKPLIRIDRPIDESATGKPADEQTDLDTPEVIGQEFIDPIEFACPIPAWMPDFKALFLTCFSPYSVVYLLWLTTVSLAVAYNFVTIPLREAFDIYDGTDYQFYWYVGNIFADFAYLLDILCARPRVEFNQDGLVKVGTFWETFDRLDQRLNAGYAVRLARTITYMIFIIHLEACGYYAFNRIQGMNASTWSIPMGKISPYVYSFYICMKTATSIGALPSATNPYEFMFMTCYWLSGIFVSAILIGQVIDILDSANANKVNYRRIMDATLSTMHHLHAPAQVTEKVRTWFMYNWDQQKTFDENSLFEVLPIKLKSDLAISVHYHTLSKVSLFQNCERALIYDMILKLKPVVFLPMDYICRKGEVGKEMYIVKSGVVEVVGGPDNSIVFVTLKEGSVFGEISLLALTGKNRRTADVRSKGFSTLFSLSKQDFEEIMKNYPQAHRLLQKRSQRMLNRDKKKRKEAEMAKQAENAKLRTSENQEEPVVEVIPERLPTPRLLETVVQAMEVSHIDKILPENLKRKSFCTLAEWRARRISACSLRLDATTTVTKEDVLKPTQKEANSTQTGRTPETKCTPQEPRIPPIKEDENPEEQTETSKSSEGSFDPLAEDWLDYLELESNPVRRFKTLLGISR
ncbi:hypothetical protein CRM22_011104 [Opisthorchis felineus]|uniref:Cyclic nucleotide-binding domain-containing protein n=1 Tax=Opisthorchis felineus TaxID=147828 RepID=A0A4S2KC14_OPIFE|nr:hypothetical protein CRM22_011104 [Opisthorchis felineus]